MLKVWKDVLEENVLKTSRAKTKLLQFRFKNEVQENKKDHNVSLESQLINKKF